MSCVLMATKHLTTVSTKTVLIQLPFCVETEGANAGKTIKSVPRLTWILPFSMFAKSLLTLQRLKKTFKNLLIRSLTL